MSERPPRPSDAAGEPRYRAFIGPPEKYDVVSAMQFNLLTALGLRGEHRLLDIGCGSLRAGRLLMMYLEPGGYFGLEPNRWLVEDGIENEIGQELVARKRPVFGYDAEFTLTAFGEQFDFLLAQSVFSHTSKRQIVRCLAEARRVMRPDAVFAATFVRGEEDYEGDDWVYPGCVTFTDAFLAEAALRNGLACRPIDWEHPNGQSWVVFSATERALALPEVSRIPQLEQQLAAAQRRIAKLEESVSAKLQRNLKRALGKRRRVR